jgi:hypothetical protein
VEGRNLGKEREVWVVVLVKEAWDKDFEYNRMDDQL